jgi:hypothetical protein
VPEFKSVLAGSWKVRKTAILAAAICFAASACSGQDSRLAGQLVGTWRTEFPKGVFREYTFASPNTNGEGQYRERAWASNGAGQSVEGFWKIATNPLMPADSRTQLKLGHIDPNWGRKEEALAIRSVSSNTLVLGSIYLSQQELVFHRVQ